jgi:hypothetical protein
MVVALGLLFGGCAVRDGRSRAAKDVSSRIVFETAPGCPTPAPDWCSVAIPAPLTEDDKTRVQSLFKRLEAHDSLRPILERFLASDYNHVVKAEHGFNFPDAEQREKAVPYDGNVAWVTHDVKALYFTRAFFATDAPADPVSGIDLRLYVVLHELMHVQDLDGKYSSSGGFRTALRGIRLVDSKGCQDLQRRFKQEASDGYFAARARERIAIASVGGTSDGGHLPSALPCGAGLFGEIFADLATHWLLDPAAPSYFPQSASAWLSEEFPQATTVRR